MFWLRFLLHIYCNHFSGKIYIFQDSSAGINRFLRYFMFFMSDISIVWEVHFTFLNSILFIIFIKSLLKFINSFTQSGHFPVMTPQFPFLELSSFSRNCKAFHLIHLINFSTLSVSCIIHSHSNGRGIVLYRGKHSPAKRAKNVIY